MSEVKMRKRFASFLKKSNVAGCLMNPDIKERLFVIVFRQIPQSMLELPWKGPDIELQALFPRETKS